MGKRIAYYQSRSGKRLSEHLTEDYKIFRDWILGENHKSISEFGESLISTDLSDFLIHSQSFHSVEQMPQEILDELTFEYLLLFCDREKNDRFELIGPLKYTYRYQKSTQKIYKIGDEELIKLWNILIYGRSILKDKPFVPMDGNNVLGYWSKVEKDILLSKLTFLHSTIKAKEREGVEFVISAINVMHEDSLELIVDVEN